MEWIEVHDAEYWKRKFPKGRPVKVRRSSIDTMRHYEDGRTRTVLGIRGTFLHITETKEELKWKGVG